MIWKIFVKEEVPEHDEDDGKSKYKKKTQVKNMYCKI
jgi:hypothetical protein